MFVTLHHYTTRRDRKQATVRRLALSLAAVAFVILLHRSAIAWGWL
jgi:hypothetical protein